MDDDLIGEPSRFQFTRPRGARPICRRCDMSQVCFNSRAREGRDNKPCQLPRLLMFQFTRPRGARPDVAEVVSHCGTFQFTRPRGARPGLAAEKAARLSFNSRAREGRDSIRLVDNAVSTLFQFTRPRGARHRPRTGIATMPGFNSRAREGRDGSVRVRRDLPGGFNSRAREGRDGRGQVL